MVQNYTPVMWDDKAFAFVPYEAFGDLPHYPKEKCEQICKELNSLIRLCTYRPKKEDIYFHPVSYVCRSGGFIVTDNQASFEVTMPKFTSQILLLFSKVLHILENLLLKNFTGLKVVS